MEGLVVDAIHDMVSGADKEVLVDVVRYIQKERLTGAHGNWKGFLNFFDRKFGDSLSDPSKRSVDLLIAFLKSFNQPKDLMLIGKIFRNFKDNKALEKHLKESSDEDSPELKLVRLTLEHPLHKKNYFHHPYSKDWLILPHVTTIKPKKLKTMLSIDCEMVLCNDGFDEVVKVCVVDRNLKAILETLVIPSKTIVDYRTAITGISAEDLLGVTCSLSDIQASIKKILKDGTILVGHSVHNDLRALKIVYKHVIDTACIFKYSDELPTFTPSLNNLCKTVLGCEVREEGAAHNCRNDAEAAMKLVLAKLEHGFEDPIKVLRRVPFMNHAILYLHRIPVEVPYEELKKVFPQDFDFYIKADVKIRGQTYSTCAVFKNLNEAGSAFQILEGQSKKDSDGRLKKLVYLRLGTGKMISFYVSKFMSLAQEGGNYSLIKICNDFKGREAKRRRNYEGHDMEITCSSKFCEHAKKIAQLEQDLSSREAEIFRLQKIVAGELV